MIKTSLALSDLIKSKPVPDEVENKVISHSQFTVYNSCPHQWRLRYINKIKPFSGSIHTVFGTSMHETLQEFLKIMYEVSAKAAEAMDMETYLQERFAFNYAKEREANDGIDFSSLEEIQEFFEDGVAILRWFVTRRSEFFSVRGMKLLGIEVHIMQPTDANPNVFVTQFLDFILYDEDTQKIIIYDIKTSTRGWKADKEQKDKTKIGQLLMYKKYFAKQYEVPLDDIEIVFFILKQKIWEKSDWPQPRIQVFRPAHGTAKINEASFAMQKFVQECFTPDGQYNEERSYSKSPGYACKYCPFNSDFDLCDQRP